MKKLLMFIFIAGCGLAQIISAQSDITVDVYVHDHYTGAPLDSALVKILHDGAVVDSSYTGADGRTQLTITLTGVEEMQPGIPHTFYVSENYPNPFRDETQVDFSIPESQTVRADVYNILGQRVLSEELTLSAGYYTMNLSLSHLSTGIYFLRLRGNEQRALKLMKIGGDVHYEKDILGRVSVQSTSRSEAIVPLQKTAWEYGDFTIQVEKDRYELWSETKQIESDLELTVPLERMNEVVFLVKYKDSSDCEHELDITGITDDNFKVAIITPCTVILKSGIYHVDGETDTIWVDKIIGISSTDTTVVLNANVLTDTDDNEYQTVKIGDQWWMAENLRTTRYRNGDTIPTNLSNTQWQNTTSGAYAIYPHGSIADIDSDDEMVAAYGKLYNWYAVVDDYGLCPPGWRVPTDGDWTTLTNYLGGSGIAGGKMKSTRTAPDDAHPRWNSPNTGATNESGFSGLPGGFRYGYGYYSHFGYGGCWWSSTEYSTDLAWYHTLNYGNSDLGRDYYNERGGFSVRCLRDESDVTKVVDVFNPATGKTWMDRNLGASRAATSSTDAQAYGHLYQWGRAADGHQVRTSDTTSILSSSNTPGHGDFIIVNGYPWDWRSPQNENLWQGVSGTNNPCPTGYRLPTEAEWEAERQSWSSNDSAGAFASPLKLPVAGYRYVNDGSLVSVDSFGNYWSSTKSDMYSRHLIFHIGSASVNTTNRGSGDSVRCIKDE